MISDEEALRRLEEGIDPATATVRDQRDTAEIRAAVQMRSEGERLVDDAVIAARHRGLTWTASGLVVPAPGGRPLHEPNVRARYWLPAIEAAGVGAVRLHDLRHVGLMAW